jgi:energy-coupling factor transport system substrate-specific component
MDRLKADFSTITLVTIPIAIAINIVIGQIIFTVKLPLYVDSIGTVLMGALAGGWVGALVGLLSNMIWGLLGNVTYAPFAAVAAIIGLLAGVFSDMGWFRKWWKAILGGLITGLVAAIVSAPIAAYVFGGVTGSGTDAFVAFFRSLGLDVLQANAAQGVFSDPLDKAATFLLVFLIIKALPARFIGRYSRAANLTDLPTATEQVD